MRLPGEFCESAEFAWSENESRSFIMRTLARDPPRFRAVSEKTIGEGSGDEREPKKLAIKCHSCASDEMKNCTIAAIRCTRSLHRRDGVYISAGMATEREAHRVSSCRLGALRKFYTTGVTVNVVILKRCDGRFLVAQNVR